jgi:glycosyltransferase involved in cell wall biosynthesis
MFLSQITPLIISFNEAPNIGRTLKKLEWAKDVVVVDSFSDDDTEAIAKGFAAVRFYQRSFDTHRNQWTFGLTNTDIKTPWVLALDADYVLTDELVAELRGLEPEASTNGYRINFIYCLNGRRLRSGIYPPLTVLFRREVATYEQDGHTQRVAVEGDIKDLKCKILHDDRKSLTRWFNSQARYSELEAEKLLTSKRRDLSWPDRMRRLCFVAPLLTPGYCLFLRGGILDGWAGLHYAFERTIAELIVSVRLIQHRLLRQDLPETSALQEPDPTPNFKAQNS